MAEYNDLASLHDLSKGTAKKQSEDAAKKTVDYNRSERCHGDKADNNSVGLDFLSALAECDGNVNELKLKFDDDVSEFESDPVFMQECMAACLPTMVQMMVMDEDAEMMDEATREAFIKVNNYFVGQGIIDEASSIRITNQKINVMHLSKDAQIKRLTSIIILKMARKDDIKQYKKYKLGQKIKKENMAQMRSRYGAKAEKLAKKLWTKLQKSKKATAVVADAKKK